MRLLIVAALVAFAVPASGETKLGAGVRIEHATAIPTLAAAPQDYVGKTIRVDGVATAVCTAMGCWMAVRAESDPKGPVLRLKVEDGAIVFPLSAVTIGVLFVAFAFVLAPIASPAIWSGESIGRTLLRLA